MMKRRGAEGVKMRRGKRNRITDTVYSSTLLYLKFLLLWAMVILADFILEFRFEFLWPFWMLLRSVYDSFKYQGLAFSVFFVCIALTSDIICFFFIPVQWIFFAASTYVWVQYVWYTEKGVCLPTMILCTVFIYMEAGVRLRDLRHMPAHLDLCRPFAAHCIGYPVVTLGFGFKSYIGYRMRQRKQREVARENSFYMQLLQQALPAHLQNQSPTDCDKNSTMMIEKVPEAQPVEKQANGSAVHSSSTSQKSQISHSKNKKEDAKADKSSLHQTHNGSLGGKDNKDVSQPKEAVPETEQQNKTSQNGTVHKEKDVSSRNSNKHSQSNGVASGYTVPEKQPPTQNNHVNVNCDKQIAQVEPHSAGTPTEEKDLTEKVKDVKDQQPSEVNLIDCDVTTEKNARGQSKSKDKKDSGLQSVKEEKKKNKNRDKEADQKQQEQNKDIDAWNRSERERERALRSALAAERQARAEITQLRQQNELLNTKLTTLNSSRQSDRAALANAERRLMEERRLRQAADARNHRFQKSGECIWEWCRQRRGALEQEVTSLRSDLQQCQEHNQTLTQSLHSSEQQVTSLTSALTSLRDRAEHLERSLSAETRIKLDLFSAVGEAKRHLGLRDGVIRTREKEIDELKGKIAQMLAIMPSDSFNPSPSGGVSKLRLSDSGLPCYPSSHLNHNLSPNNNGVNNMSTLDPNATAYTPKGAMVQCGPSSDS